MNYRTLEGPLWQNYEKNAYLSKIPTKHKYRKYVSPLPPLLQYKIDRPDSVTPLFKGHFYIRRSLMCPGSNSYHSTFSHFKIFSLHFLHTCTQGSCTLKSSSLSCCMKCFCDQYTMNRHWSYSQYFHIINRVGVIILQICFCVSYFSLGQLPRKGIIG